MQIFSSLANEAARVMYGDEVYEQMRFVKDIKSRNGVQALAPTAIIR